MPRKKSSFPERLADPLPVREALGEWFRIHRRDLPWRRTVDPYRILVSELMLQQTTVAAVLPRYGPFLDRFPDVVTLASATGDSIQALWSGLGYYARARNLQRAAEAIAKSGRFPETAAELSRLPGIGPYTAAAVASIAFSKPVAAIDGNVIRVLCRLAGLPIEAHRAARETSIRALATHLLDPAHPGDHNQAVMELGATTCLPRAPRCATCPLASFCRARAAGTPEAFPLPAKRAKTLRIPLAGLARLSGGRLFLVPDDEFVAGHWSIPSLRIGDGRLAEEALRQLVSRFDPAGKEPVRLLGTVRHTVLNRRYEAVLFLQEVERTSGGPPGRWLDSQAVEQIAHGGFLRKVLRLLSQTPVSASSRAAGSPRLGPSPG